MRFFRLSIFAALLVCICSLSASAINVDFLNGKTNLDDVSIAVTNEKLDAVNNNITATNQKLDSLCASSILQNQLLTVGLGLLFFICAVHGKNARHIW